MRQIPAHRGREPGVDLLKCFQRSALITDHQAAKFLISFAHYQTLCRSKRICDQFAQKNRLFAIVSQTGRLRQINRQASEMPPATQIQLNRG